MASADGPESHSLNPENVEFDVNSERKAQCIVGTMKTLGACEPIGLKQISSWGKAVRIVAYIRRWISYKRKRACRQERSEKRIAISATEYFDAEILILKSIQRRTFPSEIASELENIEKSSQIFQFNPKMDDQGLVRCTSRLVNSAEVVFDTANPRTCTCTCTVFGRVR